MYAPTLREILNAPAGWAHTTSVPGMSTPGHWRGPKGWGPRGHTVAQGGGLRGPPPLYCNVGPGSRLPGAIS